MSNPSLSAPVVPSSGRRTLVSVLLGLAAALAAGLVFGTVVGVTRYEIGFAAVLIGVAVGFVMARTATPTHALAPVAAVVSLVGCVFGETFGVVWLEAKAENLSLGEALPTVLGHPSVAVEILKAYLSPMSLLFWAIAAYAGFSFVRKAVAQLEARIAAHQGPAAAAAAPADEPGPAVSGPSMSGPAPTDPAAPGA